MMASQNLLNNFVSGVPTHYCNLPANYSLPDFQVTFGSPAATLPLVELGEHDGLFQIDEKQLVRAFIPLDSSGNRLDRCRRYQSLAVCAELGALATSLAASCAPQVC